MSLLERSCQSILLATTDHLLLTLRSFDQRLHQIELSCLGQTHHDAASDTDSVNSWTELLDDTPEATAPTAHISLPEVLSQLRAIRCWRDQSVPPKTTQIFANSARHDCVHRSGDLSHRPLPRPPAEIIELDLPSPVKLLLPDSLTGDDPVHLAYNVQWPASAVSGVLAHCWALHQSGRQLAASQSTRALTATTNESIDDRQLAASIRRRMFSEKKRCSAARMAQLGWRDRLGQGALATATTERSRVWAGCTAGQHVIAPTGAASDTTSDNALRIERRLQGQGAAVELSSADLGNQLNCGGCESARAVSSMFQPSSRSVAVSQLEQMVHQNKQAVLVHKARRVERAIFETQQDHTGAPAADGQAGCALDGEGSKLDDLAVVSPMVGIDEPNDWMIEPDSDEHMEPVAPCIEAARTILDRMQTTTDPDDVYSDSDSHDSGDEIDADAPMP